MKTPEGLDERGATQSAAQMIQEKFDVISNGVPIVHARPERVIAVALT